MTSRHLASLPHPSHQQRVAKEHLHGMGLALGLGVLAASLWLRSRRFRKGRGGLRDWFRRNAFWLILVGLVALAVTVAALLGASVLWSILTGVFVCLVLLVLMVGVTAKSMHRSP